MISTFFCYYHETMRYKVHIIKLNFYLLQIFNHMLCAVQFFYGFLGNVAFRAV